MMSESREALARHRRDEILLESFQAGRYAEACAVYRRALPDLKYDLYGSYDASQILLYCGDIKGALTAALGYQTMPFWPDAMDPRVLAAIRLAMRKYSEAERLLRLGEPDNLLYVALASQGRSDEAEEALEAVAKGGGFSQIVLLRHRGQAAEARKLSDVVCSRLEGMTKPLPLVLARSIESCMLAQGIEKTALKRRFSEALHGLSGLRDEINRFAEREMPESRLEVQGALDRLAGVLGSVR